MRRGGLLRATIAAAALLPFACRRTPAPSTTAAASASTSASTAVMAAPSASTSASVVAAPIDPIATVPWPALVSAHAWTEAARALDALPLPERDAIPAKLARLRVAVGRCTVEEGNRAVALADALHGAADVPSDVVARLRVDALLCAGRAKDALAVTGPASLAARKGAHAALARARAFEQAGDLPAARAAFTEAIDGSRGAGLPTGTLIAARLRVLRKLPATPEVTRAIDADRARLFVEFPLAFDAAVRDGESATAPISDSKQWLRRGEALAALGRADEAVRAIHAARAAGTPAAVAQRAEAHALWRARSYARAAAALKASTAKGDEAIEDAFLAARATSRSGDDDAAIALYEALAKKHPASKHAPEALYLAAHLRWLRGNWQGAIAAFDRYLKSPSSKAPEQESNVREAKRARAFAYLEWGKSGEARHFLHGLSQSDAYATDGFARARLELLEAIAFERGGDRAGAIAAYKRLATHHALGFIDLATRGRLIHLGETVAPWPPGPLPAASPPAFSPEVRVLAAAGLTREALARVELPKDDAARCAVYDALDEGWESYRVGLRVMSGDDAWRVRCAWPTPYAAVVAALERRERLPRGLIHAILRQESAFRVDVVSPAGAVGIAQLMPSTAMQTAMEIGVTLDPTDIAALQSPYLQLDLAARHLRALFVELAGEGASDERKQDVIPLVIAAYNAGAGSVKRWMREAPGMDTDVFIERTPYLETRGYVARVLGNLVRYAIRDGAPTPTLPRKLPPLP